MKEIFEQKGFKVIGSIDRPIVFVMKDDKYFFGAISKLDQPVVCGLWIGNETLNQQCVSVISSRLEDLQDDIKNLDLQKL